MEGDPHIVAPARQAVDDPYGSGTVSDTIAGASPAPLVADFPSRNTTSPAITSPSPTAYAEYWAKRGQQIDCGDTGAHF